MATRSLGTLTLDLVAKTGGYVDGLSKAERETRRRAQRIRNEWQTVKTAFAVAATAAVASTAALVKQSINLADEAQKTAQAIGITGDALQGLRFAADLSGASSAELETGIRQLSRAVSEAADGTAQYSDAFNKLGIQTDDANGRLRRTEDVLLDVADRFAGMEDGAAKTALAMDIFGRSGATLIPLLNQGADGIEAMTQQARDLGLIMDEETRKSAERFNDSLTVLAAAQRGWINQVTAESLPVLNELTGLMIDLATDSETASLAADAFGAVLKGVATVAIALGTTFANVGRAIGGMAAAAAQAAQGEFSAARQIIRDFTAENEAATLAAEERIGKLWSGAFREAGESAAQFAGIVRPAFETVRQELESTSAAGRGTRDAVVDTIATLEEEVATLGMSADEIERRRLALAGATEEQLAYVEALQQEIGVHKELESGGGFTGIPAPEERSEGTPDQFGDFARTAAERAQGAFADFLFEPFDSSLRDMVLNFGRTLHRMAAEAAAAQIFQSLFPQGGGSFAGSGFGDLFSGLFGGGRAHGGPVMAGSFYEVGEGNRPELLQVRGRTYLIPGNDGRVEPVGPMQGGGRHVTQVFNVQTPDADSFRRNERQILRQQRRAFTA